MNTTIGYVLTIIDCLNNKKDWSDVKEIARESRTPYAYCQKIITILSQKKYINSKRGVGVKLKKKPENIPVLKLLEDFTVNHAPSGGSKKTKILYKILQDKINYSLMGLKLDEVLEQVNFSVKR